MKVGIEMCFLEWPKVVVSKVLHKTCGSEQTEQVRPSVVKLITLIEPASTKAIKSINNSRTERVERFQKVTHSLGVCMLCHVMSTSLLSFTR
jgi:hypothetical protein